LTGVRSQRLEDAGLAYVVVADKNNVVSDLKCAGLDPRKLSIRSLAIFIRMLPCVLRNAPALNLPDGYSPVLKCA
jgi:hypothetical protein